MEQVQYISDENNNITGVIVPIGFWQELELVRGRVSIKMKNHETKNAGSMKPEGLVGKKLRNFGRMGERVKIVGDIISPVSDENEWEVLRI